jgi:septal ring factor EnvC (AmiA/AmiB activator)
MVLRKVDIGKWVKIGLIVIGLGVSAVVWASSEHSNLKDDARKETRESKKELKQTIKEQYAPLHEFTKIQQQITNQTKQIDRNANKIDNIDKNIGKLDGKLNTLLRINQEQNRRARRRTGTSDVR